MPKKINDANPTMKEAIKRILSLQHINDRSWKEVDFNKSEFDRLKTTIGFKLSSSKFRKTKTRK
ncbi:hypothetical protein ND856_15395 [Leptospira bandrabouensis]|uniref:hypothetical protein n=1 Tax=Leptospira bandrabouensis TaxID=2484903 RepID=UPI00223D60D6|nr:hypothetical protein [Leptospira bandrabouensis]MCW7478677.1 hypothetical protein [Leptospira bandrabouensis]MCW7486038.1 hypothetical protein [Leptospira bandrabouensis]